MGRRLEIVSVQGARKLRETWAREGVPDEIRNAVARMPAVEQTGWTEAFAQQRATMDAQTGIAFSSSLPPPIRGAAGPVLIEPRDPKLKPQVRVLGAPPSMSSFLTAISVGAPATTTATTGVTTSATIPKIPPFKSKSTSSSSKSVVPTLPAPTAKIPKKTAAQQAEDIATARWDATEPRTIAVQTPHKSTAAAKTTTTVATKTTSTPAVMPAAAGKTSALTPVQIKKAATREPSTLAPVSPVATLTTTGSLLTTAPPGAHASTRSAGATATAPAAPPVPKSK